MSILSHFNKIPPKMLLTLGRKSGKVLSIRALSEKSGIPVRTLARIAAMKDWSYFRQLVLISELAEACRADMIRQGAPRRAIRRMALHAKVPFAAFHADGIASFSRERRRQGVIRTMLPSTDACP